MVRELASRQLPRMPCTRGGAPVSIEVTAVTARAG